MLTLNKIIVERADGMVTRVWGQCYEVGGERVEIEIPAKSVAFSQDAQSFGDVTLTHGGHRVVFRETGESQ